MSHHRREFLFLSDRQKKRRLAESHKIKYSVNENETNKIVTNHENNLHTDLHCLESIYKPSTSHFVHSDQFKDLTTVSAETDSCNYISLTSDSSDSEPEISFIISFINLTNSDKNH